MFYISHIIVWNGRVGFEPTYSLIPLFLCTYYIIFFVPCQVLSLFSFKFFLCSLSSLSLFLI
nr:MAG TPA: protein of unknown function (UPF0242) [Caudoviricetes sp.]